MRRAVILLVPLLAGLPACAKPQPVPARPVTSTAAQQQTSTVAQPPASPVPVADGKCPYLENGFVAEANGQRVGKVKISADKPHPACFFYRSDGKLQLTVRVFVGEATQAKALV